MQKRLTLWTLGILAASLLLSGCNTFRGVGQDIKHAGQGIENAADH